MKYLKNISFGLVIGVIGYGLITNTTHFIVNSKKVTYNFSNKTMTELRTTKETLETTISNVDKMNKGSFTDEELETIKSDLNVLQTMLDELSLWELNGKKKLSINDVYNLKNEINDLPLLSLTSIAKIKTNHGDLETEPILNDSLKVMNSYLVNDIISLKNSYSSKVNLEIDSSLDYLKTIMNISKTLSTWCLEEGEPNA